MTEKYLHKSPCIYFATAEDGTIIEVNDRICETLHYSKEELTGKKADIFFTIATRIFQQTHFFPLLKMHGYADEIYITLKKSNGEELPVLMNAEKKNIDGKELYLHTGIVVYNRKRFEEELIAAKKTAEAALNENTALVQAKEQLQKRSEELDHQIFVVNKQNEELREFNRVVTHDMQEPLRKLSVFLNMMFTDDGHEQKNLLEKIRRLSNQMKDILSGLQQYVWLNESSVKLTTVDLNDVLLDVQQQIINEHPDISLTVQAEKIRNFTADWEQMHLLFYELLSNAVRFRKDDHKVFVTIMADTLQLNQFRNIEDRYKYVDHLRIQVKDEGVGLDPEHKAKVFELFRRLHAKSGRGVGLSLCKKIVDNHQGNISIDSDGEGTTVTILLPFNATATEAKNTPAIEETKLKSLNPEMNE